MIAGFSSRAAMKNEKATAELQLHSDQGVQYTSREYFNLSCTKTECIYRQKIQTIQQAKRLVDQYIWFYNNEPLS